MTTLSSRPISPNLDALVGTEHPMLDHGFIRVVDYMGNDQSIIDAARVSYGTGTTRAREDQALMHYLMRHRHTTPFEMCEIKFHVKLPIFVARQWIRHRMASVNEYSARYSILDKEFYIPEPAQLAAQSTTNRQGRGDTVSHTAAGVIRSAIESQSNENYDLYQWLLADPDAPVVHEYGHSGIARELARMSLSLNYYTQWYWKTNLHNLFHFLQLRADSHAQYEIRVYAEKMMELTEAWCPMAFNAFMEHRYEAFTFSKSAMDRLRLALMGRQIIEVFAGLSARELDEIKARLKL